MELGVFVVALVLLAGVGLMAFGRMPFPVRRAPRGDSTPLGETTTIAASDEVDHSA